jgi:hypothetical protein
MYQCPKCKKPVHRLFCENCKDSLPRNPGTLELRDGLLELKEDPDLGVEMRCFLHKKDKTHCPECVKERIELSEVDLRAAFKLHLAGYPGAVMGVPIEESDTAYTMKAKIRDAVNSCKKAMEE